MQTTLEIIRQIGTEVIPMNLLYLGKISNLNNLFGITLPNQHDVFNLFKNKNKLRYCH